MGTDTKIEWADHTFNPWIGCTAISPACDNCYAEALMDKRYGRVRWGSGEDRSRTAPSNWAQPRRWNRDAEKAGTRPFVFCASLEQPQPIRAMVADALAPILAKVRRDALEEAVGVAGDWGVIHGRGVANAVACSINIAAAIRALGEKG